MKKRKKAARSAKGAPVVRLPLPKKGQKRHGDAKKYHRPREKERLRQEEGNV